MTAVGWIRLLVNADAQDDPTVIQKSLADGLKSVAGNARTC